MRVASISAAAIHVDESELGMEEGGFFFEIVAFVRGEKVMAGSCAGELEAACGYVLTVDGVAQAGVIHEEDDAVIGDFRQSRGKCDEERAVGWACEERAQDATIDE